MFFLTWFLVRWFSIVSWITCILCSEIVVPSSSCYSLLPSHDDGLGFVHNTASADLHCSGGEGILAWNCWAKMVLRALLKYSLHRCPPAVSLLLNQDGSPHVGSVDHYLSGDWGMLPYYRQTTLVERGRPTHSLCWRSCTVGDDTCFLWCSGGIRLTCQKGFILEGFPLSQFFM